MITKRQFKNLKTIFGFYATQHETSQIKKLTFEEQAKLTE